MSERSSLPATANPALQQIDALSQLLAVSREQSQQQLHAVEEKLREARAAFEAQLEDRSLQQRISTLESETSQLAENLKEQRAGRDAAERRLAEVNTELEKGQQRLKELQQELIDRTTSSEAARDRVAALEKQAKQHEEVLASQQAAWQLEQTRLEQEITNLRQEQESNQRSLKETEQAAAQASERDVALEQTKLALSALEEEKNGLAAALASTREQCEGLQARLTAQELAIEETRAARDVQVSEAASLQTEIARLRQELDQSMPAADVDKMKTALAETTEKVRVLEEKLQSETSRGNKAQIASQLAEALRDAEVANEEAARLRRELDQLRPADDRARGAGEVARLQEVVARQVNHQKRTLGDLLVEAGIVTPAQVNECLEIQKRNPHQHIGAILIERHLASEEAIAHGLAYQCGVEFMRLDGRDLAEGPVQLLSERLASKHLCIPVDANGDTMTLAMANPVDLVAIEDIERATGKSVEVVVGTEADIKAAIAKYY